MTRAVREPLQERSRRSLEAIYAAAVDLLALGGWDAVTVGEIERRSGVTRGTFYLRFPTREALVDYVRDRVMAEVSQQQAAAFANLGEGGPLDVEDAARRTVTAIDEVFVRVGRVMFHLAGTTHSAFGADAITAFARDATTVLRRGVQGPGAEEAVAFAIEMAFAAFVGRQRTLTGFPGHPVRTDREFLDEVTLMISAYLKARIGL